MLHTRRLVSVFVVALLGAPGCTGSHGVSGDAQPERKTGDVQPERKTGHGVSADAQPERKTGHGVSADAQPERKTGHGNSADAQPERKTGHGADAPQEKRNTGMAVGEIKSTKNSADGKNVSIEVLQPGEEKPRSYHVVYDPEKKAPNAAVVAAVRAAKVGDRVIFDWVQTGHGPAVTKFEVVKQAAKTDKD